MPRKDEILEELMDAAQDEPDSLDNDIGDDDIPDDDGVDETEDESTEESEAAQQEQLIFGKYKSLAEAEKGYRESERKMHELGQRCSELERILTQGQQQTYQQPYQQQAFPQATSPTDNPYVQQYNEGFLENPFGSVIETSNYVARQVVREMVGEMMKAEANKQQVFQKMQNEPHFETLKPEIEAMLAGGDISQFQDPEKLAQIVDGAYNYLIGIKVRKGELSLGPTQRTQTTPEEMINQAKRAGVNVPDSTDNEDLDIIDESARDALVDMFGGAGMNLDSNATKRIIANARKREKSR